MRDSNDPLASGLHSRRAVGPVTPNSLRLPTLRYARFHNTKFQDVTMATAGPETGLPHGSKGAMEYSTKEGSLLS